MELYFVSICKSNGDIVEKRVTDKENLGTAIKYAKHDYPHHVVYVNKASMCYDGYLVNGECVERY